jgi:heptosyltransferase-2
VQAIARACPYVDELIVFPTKRRPPPFDQVRTYLDARQFARTRLKARRFDCALIPRADIDNAGALAMAYHADVPCRIGFSQSSYPLKAVKNRGYDRFLTHVFEPGEALHEVIRTLDLAGELCADVRDTRLELWPSEEDEARADDLLAQFGQPGRLLIALAPGAGIERRQWPTARFAELAVLLVETMGAQIVIVGGPTDEPLARAILSQAGKASGQILNLAGRTSLGATAAVLRRCALFVGNDSGPMHMAAAMRTPCVEISCHPAAGNPVGANSPLRFSPWRVPSRVLQPASAIAPCSSECAMSHAHCITAVTVDAVLDAARDLLISPHQSRAFG